MDPLITKDMPERRTAMHLREGRGSNQREEDIAAIGMLTGNKNITGPSAIMAQQVNQKQIQNTRQNAIRDQQDQTADYQDRALKQTMDIARLEEQGRKDVANATAQTAEREAVLKDVKDLGKQIQSSGDLQIINSMEALNKLLASYKGKNIPGSGGVMNTLAGMLTSEGRAVQQAISAVRNALLKERSGGAVTPAEQERMYQEFGTTMFNTDADLIRGVAMLNARVQADLDGYEKQYQRPGVMEMYNSGMRPLTINLYEPAAPAGGGPPPPPGAGAPPPPVAGDNSDLDTMSLEDMRALDASLNVGSM